MINVFKRKLSSKNTIINLNGLYNIFKKNYFEEVNNHSDYDSIESDWINVGSDLKWALKIEQKRMVKHKM